MFKEESRCPVQQQCVFRSFAAMCMCYKRTHFPFNTPHDTCGKRWVVVLQVTNLPCTYLQNTCQHLSSSCRGRKQYNEINGEYNHVVGGGGSGGGGGGGFGGSAAAVVAEEVKDVKKESSEASDMGSGDDMGFGLFD